ncbi:uncharacterized protein LOC113306486 [Papaver somniferum]|uniref:uncharacterized protein LOC113306486 n=1 Tax=Papaver somniferum TaxID=3469 RepID=UPI000E6FC022|nr:uncharacterized protein LOC113306486 [Papaver somniferum]
MYVVMKCLCKGIPPDSIDDYNRMAASTIYYYIKKFCDAIMFGFNEEYMIRPTVNDLKWLTMENAARGFPGMLGSWTVCIGVGGWFWHGYFGVGGSNNDLNVLKSTNLFDDNLNGIAPPCHFTINGNQYTQGYYLVDGIYKSYSVLVQAYGAPSGIPILELFRKYQMAKKKDVERPNGHLGHCKTSEALQNPVLQERLRTDLEGHIWERHGQGLRDGEMPGDAIDNELDSGEDTDEVDVDQDHYDP